MEDLEEIFQYEVFKMLKKEGKITDAVIENMLSWCHSGFHVYIGDRIFSDDQTGLGNLARYIIRACFSQERMVYMFRPCFRLILLLMLKASTGFTYRGFAHHKFTPMPGVHNKRNADVTKLLCSFLAPQLRAAGYLGVLLRVKIKKRF